MRIDHLLRLTITECPPGGMPDSDFYVLSPSNGTTVGRAEENTLRLPDYSKAVSRYHCEIYFDNGLYILVDTSTHGTFLDGYKVDKGKGIALQAGSSLKLGGYNLEVTVEGSQWREGCVKPENDHIKLRYNANPVALVSNQNGSITVQFLDEIQNDVEAKEAVIKSLDFYFGTLNEANPWEYAIYHCGTGSNAYSDVHWGYYPKGYKGR